MRGGPVGADEAISTTASSRRGLQARARQELAGRARRIRLLILDVDGVLTDGRIVVSDDGGQTKLFDVRDGFGLVLAKEAGLRTALITAERSRIITCRARRLKVSWVAQFARDKARALERCLAHFHLPAQAAAYMGDDLLDLPVLTRVGLSAAPADAAAEVKRHVHYVARVQGGHGAVRELVELILKAQGRWDGILRRYLPRD